MSIIDDVRKNLDVLVKKNDRIVIAVSGGADSLALLHIILKLRVEYTLDLCIAHLDHGLRSNSFTEALMVAKIAQANHLPFYVSCDCLLQYHNASIEERARKARYEFLKRCAEKFKANSIAVAHHADDQAETLLFNLMRGCGVLGLSGIPAKRRIDMESNIHIIRPLLSVPKSQLLEFLSSQNIEWVEDDSNQDTTYTRNKIRQTLIPTLRSEFCPHIISSLNKTATHCRQISNFADRYARDYFAKTKTTCCPSTHLDDLLQHFIPFVALDTNLFCDIPDEVMPFFMKVVLEKMHIHIPIREYHYQMIRKLKKQSSGEVDFSAQLTLMKKQHKVLMYRRTSIHSSSALLKNEVYYASIKFELFQCNNTQKTTCPYTQKIDLQKVSLPLKVRAWCESDIMKPLGLSGKKKVSKILKDIKLYSPLRDHIPVVVDNNNEVIWLVGIRIADKVKITKNTKEVFALRCTWEI